MLYQNETTMITLCLALSFKGTKTEIAKMVTVTVILDLLTFASATF